MRTIMRTVVVACAAFFLFATNSASGDIPLAVNHQGIVEVEGAPFSGSGEFRFALVDPATGNNLWTNDGSNLGTTTRPDSAVTLTVTDGVYSVGLGDVSVGGMTAIPATVFDSATVALRIWFSDGVHGVQRLAPDQAVTSAAYAFHALRAETANDADTLDGLHATAFSDAGHDHAFYQINGTVTDAQVPNNITVNYAATAGDADTLDGLHATAFADAGHDHAFYQINGTVTDAQVPNNITVNYAATAGDADTLDGQDATSFVSTTGPESVTGTSTGNILTVTNSGTGGVGRFEITNTASNGAALFVQTNGGGAGGSAAGFFQYWHPESSVGNALRAYSNGNDYTVYVRGIEAGEFATKGMHISTQGGQALYVQGGDVQIDQNVTVGGNHSVSGTKSAVVPTSQGNTTLYSEESSEVWFADYGFGRVENGAVTITIDPLFAETVNLDEAYHVFLQAYDDAACCT